MRKLVGLFATAAIVVAACGGTSATQAPASVAAPTAPAASAEAPSGSAEAPSASGAAGEINLFGTAYAPTEPSAQGGSRSSSAIGRKPRSSTRTTSAR